MVLRTLEDAGRTVSLPMDWKVMVDMHPENVLMQRNERIEGDYAESCIINWEMEGKSVYSAFQSRESMIK